MTRTVIKLATVITFAAVFVLAAVKMSAAQTQPEGPGLGGSGTITGTSVSQTGVPQHGIRSNGGQRVTRTAEVRLKPTPRGNTRLPA